MFSNAIALRPAADSDTYTLNFFSLDVVPNTVVPTATAWDHAQENCRLVDVVYEQLRAAQEVELEAAVKDMIATTIPVRDLLRCCLCCLHLRRSTSAPACLAYEQAKAELEAE